MKSDAIAFGVAGVLFGLIAGGSSARSRSRRALRRRPRCRLRRPRPAERVARGVALTRRGQRAQNGCRTRRVEWKPRAVANLYFDAERYDDAIKCGDAPAEPERRQREHGPGVCITTRTSRQGARAVRPLLKIDPKHAKTSNLDREGVCEAGSRRGIAGLAAGLFSWRPTALRARPPSAPDSSAPLILPPVLRSRMRMLIEDLRRLVLRPRTCERSAAG